MTALHTLQHEWDAESRRAALVRRVRHAASRPRAQMLGTLALALLLGLTAQLILLPALAAAVTRIPA